MPMSDMPLRAYFVTASAGAHQYESMMMHYDAFDRFLAYMPSLKPTRQFCDILLAIISAVDFGLH